MSSFDRIYQRGQDLATQGRIDDAIGLYDGFLQSNSDSHPCRDALAALRKIALERPALPLPAGKNGHDFVMALIAAGDFRNALIWAQKLAITQPEDAQSWNVLGMAHFRTGNAGQAEHYLRRAVQIDRNLGIAWANIGLVLHAQEKLDAALVAFGNASYLNPTSASVHATMGGILEMQGRLDEAEQACVRAIKCNPDYSRGYHNLANVFLKKEKLPVALQGYERVIALEPGYQPALSSILHLRSRLCVWPVVPSNIEGSDFVGGSGGGFDPFHMLTVEDNPQNQQKRARLMGQRHSARVSPMPILKPGSRLPRLKVGYFSADFHSHATMLLMQAVFRLHDRDSFEIHAYSYGKEDHGARRKELVQSVDGFWDIRNSRDVEVAAHTRNIGIDIAIDLKGYTRDNRTGMFAQRLAPIQISHVGFPGTLGCDFIDYFIADHVVIPDEYRPFYSENIIYMPNCYQPNDHERPVGQALTTRVEMGLPENGFVFCSFNANYKIGPREFDIWMRLLHKVEGSVLWLLQSNEWAPESLRREARVRGIDPSRLIFAQQVDEEAHLERHRHADLFLDCFNVNAHTTASDALWAGLPLITLPGRQFAARVAASILHAAGLSELIASSEEHYEAMALELALDQERMNSLRQRMQELRLTCPLFDSVTYTRDLEAGYRHAYDRYFSGQAAADFNVADIV